MVLGMAAWMLGVAAWVSLLCEDQEEVFYDRAFDRRMW